MELTGSKKTTKRFRKNGFNRRELKRCDEIRNVKGSYSNNKVAGIEYFTIPRRIIDATKTVKIVRMLWKRKLFFFIKRYKNAERSLVQNGNINVFICWYLAIERLCFHFCVVKQRDKSHASSILIGRKLMCDCYKTKSKKRSRRFDNFLYLSLLLSIYLCVTWKVQVRKLNTHTHKIRSRVKRF